MRNLSLLGILVSLSTTLAVAQQAAPPVLSSEPINAERMDIYQDFLRSYLADSKNPLNVSQFTEMFEASDDDLKSCLKSFTKADISSPKIRALDAKSFPKEHVHLVDPKTHKKSDPGDAIRNGANVDSAVEAGFAAGIFTFSEIVFNATHTKAAFTTSFRCGSLCGNGGVHIYELDHGKWKPSKISCGYWIS